MSQEEPLRQPTAADIAALAAQLGPGALLAEASARERYAQDETEDLRFLPAAAR